MRYASFYSSLFIFSELILIYRELSDIDEIGSFLFYSVPRVGLMRNEKCVFKINSRRRVRSRRGTFIVIFQ